MLIYILMLILSIALCYVSTKVKNRKLKILLQISSALPFFIISAIRYDVGTDYLYRYFADFEYIKRGGTPPNLEIGFLAIVKGCLLFSQDSALLFAITSAIIIFSIFAIIYKYSKNPMLSIFIFFAGCFFFQSLNVIRQYMAAVFVVLSYHFIIEKKYKSCIACIIAAALLHTTSLVSLIAIFLAKKILLKPKVIVIILLIVFVFSGLFNSLIDFVLANTRFSVYVGTSYDRGEIKYIALFVNLLLYILSYYAIKKKDNLDRRDILYINLMGTAVVFASFGKIYFLFNRLTYYFAIIQILAVPYFIDIIKYNSKSLIFSEILRKQKISDYLNKVINKLPIIKSKTIEVQNQIIVVTMVVGLLTANIIYTNVLHNDDEVLPYKTVFNK